MYMHTRHLISNGTYYFIDLPHMQQVVTPLHMDTKSCKINVILRFALKKLLLGVNQPSTN